MSRRTLRCSTMSVIASPNVLPVCYGLQMCWVHARTITAQVVEFQAFRNTAYERLVRETVGCYRAPIALELPVAARSFPSRPNPAPNTDIVHVDLGHESVRRVELTYGPHLNFGVASSKSSERGPVRFTPRLRYQAPSLRGIRRWPERPGEHLEAPLRRGPQECETL